MYSKDSFRDLIITELKRNIHNNYSDNWDYPSFGEYSEPVSLKKKLKSFLSVTLPKPIYYKLIISHSIGKHLDGLCYLYNNLENDTSKDLLIKIIAYRILGHKKVKLPLNNPTYWQNLKKAEGLMINEDDMIDPKFFDFKLHKHDLNPIGYPIIFYFTPVGVLIEYIIKEYVYEEKDVLIKANKNDIVIDAGACWGDTALFFSNEVGDKGRVYSFEFVPGNIEIFEKNLGLNPDLANRITLVARPLWNRSGIDVYYDNNGPATKVSMEKFNNYTGSTATLSIDDFVRKENPERINFIKMDIEGAEPFTIEGAKETIIKFKPKLAIAIYHSLSDHYTILKFIKSLNLGYKFYLQHATIHTQETVLFAAV